MTFTHELCPPYRVSMKELKAYIRASDEQMCSKANCTDFLCGSKWFGIFAFSSACFHASFIPRAVSDHDQKFNYN